MGQIGVCSFQRWNAPVGRLGREPDRSRRWGAFIAGVAGAQQRMRDEVTGPVPARIEGGRGTARARPDSWILRRSSPRVYHSGVNENVAYPVNSLVIIRKVRYVMSIVGQMSGQYPVGKQELIPRCLCEWGGGR